MPVAIPVDVKMIGKAYVGLRCDHCGMVITRKFYDKDIKSRDHVFCDHFCKKMWEDEHLDFKTGKTWHSIYDTIDVPNVCRAKLKNMETGEFIKICEECPLPDCRWDEAKNTLNI